MGLEGDVGRVGEVVAEGRVRRRLLVFVRGPDVHAVGVGFGGQQLAVHWGAADYGYFARVAYYLLHFYVGMLLCRLIVKYRF